MWWEPASEHEREVSDWLRYGMDRFLSERENGQVWGIGSYISTDGPQPLILLTEALIGEPSPVPRLLSLQLLPASIREQLSRWEFPERTAFLAVTEPEPLSNSSKIPIAAGDILYCPVSKEKGTAGPAVEGYDDNGNKFVGILTAGHVTPNGIGSSVEIVQQRRLLPPLYQHIGSVVHHCDPALMGGAGYDVSVIKLDSDAYATGFRPSGIAKIQSPLTQPLLCSMYGGVSGTFHQVGIVGALTCFGNHNRLWLNSWLMLPSSVAALGDSGALVSVNHTSEAIGLLVGGSRAINTQWYLCWYAQDISSIQSSFLDKCNIKIL